MIITFGDKATEDLFEGLNTKIARKFPADVAKTALRKLDMIEASVRLEDIKAPPGNRLEMLRGDWKGYFSIRVNDQWRIVFRWVNGNALDVSLTDYH